MKLEGSARTRYVLASSILASVATGNVSLCSARNGVTRAGSESTETASITKPCSLYRRCSRSIAGISSRHGAHHVAQKLIKTGLPRCSLSLKVSPPRTSATAKSSASFWRGGRIRSSSRAASSRASASRSGAGAPAPPPSAGGAGAGPSRAAAGASGPGRISAKKPVPTTTVTTPIVTVRARSRRMSLPGSSPSSRAEYASIPPPSAIDPQTCYSRRPAVLTLKRAKRREASHLVAATDWEESSMEDRELRTLIGAVKAGTLSRRRFVQMMVGLGLTAPMSAQMLASAGVAQAPTKWTFNPTKRGGGGLVKTLWWQAPTLLNPHFANGTKDQDACRIFYEPLGGYDPDGNIVPVLAAEVPSLQNGQVAKDGLSVTWRLKKNVAWHDGKPFTADGVG